MCHPASDSYDTVPIPIQEKETRRKERAIKPYILVSTFEISIRCCFKNLHHPSRTSTSLNHIISLAIWYPTQTICVMQ